MFFFDDETFRISEEYYTITIIKITKCYIYFLIELQPDIDPFILQKKKRKDDKGEYVKFCIPKKALNSVLYPQWTKSIW